MAADDIQVELVREIVVDADREPLHHPAWTAEPADVDTTLSGDPARLRRSGG